MGFNIKHMILSLAVVSAFISLASAEGGCSGSCAISSGGGSSSSFMSDPAFNIGMSSYDEFVRDNIGQTSLSSKSISQFQSEGINSSLNQTSDTNASQISIGVLPVTNSLENTSSNEKTVKLGTSGLQDRRISTLVFTTFNNKF
jgi:hypothetical protein